MYFIIYVQNMFQLNIKKYIMYVKKEMYFNCLYTKIYFN